MLKADSSAEKSESALHSKATAPIADSVAAFSWTALTTLTIDSTDWSGKMSSRYPTSALDESAWSSKPSTESARKISGTNEARAKYATIAARCVPRSVKKRSNVALIARIGGSLLASSAGHGCICRPLGARRSLDAGRRGGDHGTRRPRRGGARG